MREEGGKGKREQEDLERLSITAWLASVGRGQYLSSWNFSCGLFVAFCCHPVFGSWGCGLPGKHDLLTFRQKCPAGDITPRPGEGLDVTRGSSDARFGAPAQTINHDVSHRRWRSIRRHSAQLAQWAKLLILTALASPNLPLSERQRSCDLRQSNTSWDLHDLAQLAQTLRHVCVVCFGNRLRQSRLEDVARTECARTAVGALQISSPGISRRTLVVQQEFTGS